MPGEWMYFRSDPAAEAAPWGMAGAGREAATDGEAAGDAVFVVAPVSAGEWVLCWQPVRARAATTSVAEKARRVRDKFMVLMSTANGNSLPGRAADGEAVASTPLSYPVGLLREAAPRRSGCSVQGSKKVAVRADVEVGAKRPAQRVVAGGDGDIVSAHIISWERAKSYVELGLPCVDLMQAGEERMRRASGACRRRPGWTPAGAANRARGHGHPIAPSKPCLSTGSVWNKYTLY